MPGEDIRASSAKASSGRCALTRDTVPEPSARTIDMVRETSASTAGNNLTVQAGGANSGRTDLASGNLVLSSGISTGTHIRTYTVEASGEHRTDVIAQEMLWKHPDMVHIGQEGLYGVEAPNVRLLVKAVQELKAANDDLITRISADDDALKAANDNIADLRAQFEAYKEAHP
jgi:hypothetical protein